MQARQRVKRKRKLSKSKTKQLKMGKVPVEIALEDLMRHVAKQGVPKFTWKEKKIADKRQFTLFFQIPNQNKQYTSMSSNNAKEIKCLRSMFKDYCKELNKEIRAGNFKPSESSESEEKAEEVKKPEKDSKTSKK